MAQSLTFSRGRLADFLACQRRFQLRYQRRLAWPVGPLDGESAAALERGRRFHQLLQQQLLGLLPAQPVEDEPALGLWWQLFQSQGPSLPAGTRLTEFNLTAPIGRHFLTGRFDLLIATEEGLHIYDWKTGVRPRSLAALREDLQTRVYLGLAAEGAPALWRAVRPETIQLTYWYASDPPVSRSLAYDSAWHADNWANLAALVDQIEAQVASGDDLPLTEDLTQCRRCVYQAYCHRLSAGMDLAEWQADSVTTDDRPLFRLEPDRL